MTHLYCAWVIAYKCALNISKTLATLHANSELTMSMPKHANVQLAQNLYCAWPLIDIDYSYIVGDWLLHYWRSIFGSFDQQELFIVKIQLVHWLIYGWPQIVIGTFTLEMKVDDLHKV